MKNVKNISILLLIILSVVVSKTHKNRKNHNKAIPMGFDLKNHFGSYTVGDSPYGPKTSYEGYVETNPEVFTPQRYSKYKELKNYYKFQPYPGYEKRLNPFDVKSGEFTNIAPSAENIINPEYATPKMHIQSQLSYPAHVKVPTFYGFRKEMYPVSAYDKLEGRIIEDKIVLNKPVYGWEDKVNIYT